MSEDPFGQIIGPEAVIDATVTTLERWMPEYLADIERKAGLMKGAITRPLSYHGGINWGSYEGRVLPEVMVLVKALGEPERSSSSGYTQAYDIKVGCVCIGAQLDGRAEDEARVAASHLGTASMLLVQKPELGGLASRLVMVAAPAVSLPDEDHREIVQAISGFTAWVNGIISETGPVGEIPETTQGYQGKEEPLDPVPTVETVGITINPTQGD